MLNHISHIPGPLYFSFNLRQVLTTLLRTFAVAEVVLELAILFSQPPQMQGL